jgi:glycosyltransferase involved in cell wall biosynthesis
LRILHLIPNFTGGGAERQLALLAPELCRLGVEVHVAFCESGVNSKTNLELFSGSEVRLHDIPGRGTHDPTILLHILRVIRLIRPDLIQTWILQMDVLGGLAARLAGVPFVLSERSSALAYPPTWKYWLRTQVGRCAVSIVANSQGGAAYWKPWATRIAVIRNGLSLDLIRNTASADPAVLGFHADARLILCAGRLSPEKNLDILVQALDKVLVKRPDCVAVLFGDGELRSSIQSRVEMAQAHERIRLLGYTNELWSWMRRASAFVSVSRFEGNPNAVLEAMAVGCPLVVSSIPQHREILDDSTAILCDLNSVEEVAAAICKALSDPVAAAARAEAARRRSAEWSVEETARQYLRFYETTLTFRQDPAA